MHAARLRSKWGRKRLSACNNPSINLSAGNSPCSSYWNTAESNFWVHCYRPPRSETLEPGEFLGSGTVGDGCGVEHARFLEPGDIVELEVERIGVPRNRIVRRPGG